eukprot:71522_1
MSLFWIYICFIILIISLEIYKLTSIKTQKDVIFESWEEYNVRVHSRIPKYNGPNPFERHEPLFYESVKRLIMIPIAIIRVFLFAILVILGAIVSIPASQLRFQRKATSKLLRFFCRVILFIFGFYNIPVRNLNNKNIDYNKSARVIVANHHTVFDGLLLLYYTNGCIAAKAELKKVPFFGQVLIALNTLFINRHGKDGRNRAKQQIIDHVHNDNLPPLIVFPQGTTSSIYTLTTFKPGAFLSKKSVLPIVFNWSYNQNNDLSYVGQTNMLNEMFYAGSQLINYVHITICKPYKPDNKHELEPHKFAENTRKLMNRYIKTYCRMTPHSLTDSLLYDFAVNKQQFFTAEEIPFIMSDISSSLKLRSKTVQYLAKKFSALDLNKNGYIEYDEFCKAFNRDPVKHFDKMSKLFQLFSVNNNFNKIGFDEFLNGVSICFVDSMISDAIRVIFDACSVNNKIIKQNDISNVFNRQIDKERFQDDNEYNIYKDKVKFFENILFNFNKINELNFNTFHTIIMEKHLTNSVQEFLQMIVMIRLKIKLKKADFKVNESNKADVGDSVSVQEQPRIIRSDSIMSVGGTTLDRVGNKL